MSRQKKHYVPLIALCLVLVAGVAVAVVSAQQGKVVSSYGPVNQDVTFDQIKADRMAVKADRAKEHTALLNSRYDLSKKVAAGSVMSGGKPLPIGPTAKLKRSSDVAPNTNTARNCARVRHWRRSSLRRAAIIGAPPLERTTGRAPLRA